ncbi:MAG: histidine kinase dimerization/phospho-acceptor domain-containing protein, partial [Caulobacterales bacterium]
MNATKTLPAVAKVTEALFDGLPVAVICFDAEDRIIHANAEAESIFSQTLETMMSVDVSTLMPFTPALPALLSRCRREFARVTQSGIILHGMSFEPVEADAIAAPYTVGGDNSVIIALFTHRRGRELAHVSELDAAMRSVAGMAGVLSHEIKNPLAGIRGAAQLLMRGVPEAERQLAQLITEEVDRIRRLVDTIERFGDGPIGPKKPVNIHLVLERVRALAATSFASDVVIKQHYDPSLPPVAGDEDRLVQLFLNLVKNAAEAAANRVDDAGEIEIRTAYRRGVKLSAGRPAVAAPLEVSIKDNGPGIPAELRSAL